MSIAVAHVHWIHTPFMYHHIPDQNMQMWTLLILHHVCFGTSGCMFQVKVSFLCIRLYISAFIFAGSRSFYCCFSLDLIIYSSFVLVIGTEKIISSSSVSFLHFFFAFIFRK